MPRKQKTIKWWAPEHLVLKVVSIGGFQITVPCLVVGKFAEQYAMLEVAEKFIRRYPTVIHSLGSSNKEKAVCIATFLMAIPSIVLDPGLLTREIKAGENSVTYRDMFLNLLSIKPEITCKFYLAALHAASNPSKIYVIMSLLRENPHIKDQSGRFVVRAVSASLSDVAAQNRSWNENDVKQARRRLQQLDAPISASLSEYARRKLIRIQAK